MNRRIVATIMDRHYLGDRSFIFSCNHAAVGTMNEDTGIFTDLYGNEYVPITSRGLMESEIPFGYSNIISLADLKEELGGNLTSKEAISEYEYLCRRSFFIVKMNEEEQVYCLKINMNDIESKINNMNSEETQETDEQNNESQSSLEQIIIDMVDGKYSLNELKSIRDKLESSYEDYEWALESIKMQIEATENNVSATELPEDPEGFEYEEKEAPKKRRRPQIEKNSKENSLPIIDIEDLFQKVTKTLIAQDEPARRVIAEIARKELDSRKKAEGILLTGSTGVGKTELMRLIAKYLNRPFFKVDSNQLTTAGYTGKDIEEVLWDLYIACNRNIEEVENAIIFFDEIDKKGSSRKDDHSGQGVLNVLLPFIEGTTYDACEDMRNAKEKVKINTNNMIVILGGAYTDVYRNLAIKNIGFNKQVSSKPIIRPATTQDFIEKGMMTDEFMGRVTVVKLNDLDVNDIKRVMLESDESAIRIQEAIFEKLGVKITFTDSYVSEIAKNAYEKHTGARGLNGIIDETTWKAFADVYTHLGEFEEVVLDADTVKDPSNYQLVKKKVS